MTDYEKLLGNPMTLRAIKYHVPSKGEIGKDRIWRIYIDIKNGHTKTEYFDHIEFVGVSGHTGENLYRIGYAYFSECAVAFDYDPSDNFRRYAVMHDGSYNPKYIKDDHGRIVENDR